MRVTAPLVVLTLTVCATVAAGDFPEIEGWAASSEVQHFGPETLWEYINGAADVFLASGFQQLTVRNLRAGELEVTVNIYDMGTPLNAFGVYATEAGSDAARVDAGAAAAVSPPYQALLCKGPRYVKVDAYEGELDDATARSLVAAIAAALPGDHSLPEAFSVLPETGRVVGSEGFAREGFLGLAELANCVHATYTDDDGSTYRAFVVVSQGGEEVDQIWRRLARRWVAVDDPRGAVLARKVPYQGLVGVRSSSGRLIGVSDCASKEQLLQRLEEISGAS
jgi:hypothetical protein